SPAGVARARQLPANPSLRPPPADRPRDEGEPMPLPFTRREPAVEDGPLLDDLLAFYEVTTPVADRTRPTGLPAPTRRRRGAPAPAAPPTPQASPDELAEAIGEPDLSSAVLEPAVAATA